jgi:hypothetical protein
LPNSAEIRLGGVDSYDAREKHRGDAYILVAIDEAGSIEPEILTYTIEDVLHAALFDHDGQLILCGTPHATASGFFFEADNSPEWSHHHWNLQMNPKLPRWKNKSDWQDLAAKLVAQDKEKTPPNKFLRETMGIWARDENSLLYIIDRSKNVFGSLPKNEAFSYVFGIDTRIQ